MPIIAGDLFKALADDTRRRILDELTERNGQTLFEICSRLAMRHGIGSSRQAISQHLAVLEEAPDGTELVLEPDAHPAVRPFKEALVEDGVPFNSFAVDDVQAEFERLRSRGVEFIQEPVESGPVTTAVFADTCGNLLQIHSQA